MCFRFFINIYIFIGRDYFLVLEPLSRTLTDQLVTWCDEVNARKRFGKKEVTSKESLMNARLASILGLVSALSYLHRRKWVKHVYYTSIYHNPPWFRKWWEALTRNIYQSICYRDLKTGNIGFDKYDKIKLFDFGLATELKEVNRVGVDQYHATECTGTPRYMAREVYYGEPYGLPCDVFSFSLILYEVVALQKATTYNDFDEHAKKVYEKNRRPKMDRTVPQEVKTWIMTGWSNDPTVRPKMSRIWSEMTEYLTTNGYDDAF